MLQSSERVLRRRLGALLSTALVSLVSLVGLAGCSEDPTELLVVVDTDLGIPAEMDEVSISVTGPSGDEVRYPVALTGPGAVELPLVLGLVPESDLLEPVTVRATGRLGGAPVVERAVRTGFLKNEIRVVRLLLLRNCVGRMCAADESCSEDGCVPVAVAATTLPRWGGPPDRFDAGTPMPDAGMQDTGMQDTGMPDAGVDAGPICDPGFEDCDGMPDNGCEADLSSAGTCGDCSTSCSGATGLCGPDGAGGFACTSTCSPPSPILCTGSCVDTDTSLSHCGGCDVACPARANATRSCTAGVCGFSCNTNFDDCDGMAGSGCETSLTTLTDCGGCGTGCSRAHASATCATGSCRLDVCDAGWGNCDGSFSNGCETDLTTGANCGMCGRACPGSEACVAGTCTGGDAIVQVSAGSLQTCARRASGAVLCWGDNGAGQLGDGTRTDRRTPTPVVGLTDATHIWTGGGGMSVLRYHSCAVRASGAVACWGDNDEGQLGDGTTTDRTTPVPVTGLSGARRVVVGRSHSCALSTSGSVRCWGDNGAGSLGDGLGGTHGDGSLVPVTPTGIAGAADIVTGASQTCVGYASGGVECWGRNDFGQVGDGTTVDRVSPVGLSGLPPTEGGDGGANHTCAVLTTGAVRCWGDNVEGQLGDGTVTMRTSSVAVTGLPAATQVSAGGEHTCAVLTTGAVRCWGDGFMGRLGNGMSMDSRVPVVVTGLSDAVEVTAGGVHTCALRSGGQVLCWGGNAEGQLGDGTVTNRGVPTPVAGL